MAGEEPERGIHPPPPISTPSEAPWTDIAKLIYAIENQTVVMKSLVTVMAAGFGLIVSETGEVTGGAGGEGGAGGTATAQAILSVMFPVLQRDAWDHDHVYVPNPGTAVNLPAMPIPKGFGLVVRALLSNTDSVYVGKSESFASNANKRIALAAGEAIKLFISDASKVYVDAAVANEGVVYFSEV